MIRFLPMLMHAGATSGTRLLASDGPPLQEQVYRLEQYSESSILLDNAKENNYRYSQFVELNLRELTSAKGDFEVVKIEKEGPDWNGFLTYTVTQRQTVRQVFSLFYTVKLDSPEDTLLFGRDRLIGDSVRDLFPMTRSDFDCVVVDILYTTCWPRMTTSPNRFCTFEVKFKHPLLTNEAEKIDTINVNNKFTSEYGNKYNGMYFQINGKGTFATDDLTPLTTGKVSHICRLDVVFGNSTPSTSPGTHVGSKKQEVMALIFGGDPSDYVAEFRNDAPLGGDPVWTLEIDWGVTNDCTMNNFAMKKSVERANGNLPSLTTSIFQDGWKITEISNRAVDAS